VAIDLKKYVGAYFLRLPDVKDAPLSKTIETVEEGAFDKLELGFSDGSKLSLNVTNTRALVTAFGETTDSWTGKRFAGELDYRGSSSRASWSGKPPASEDLNDSIPI
jgi:hypothetical protein